jgi:AcrR family transcriptional regulator
LAQVVRFVKTIKGTISMSTREPTHTAPTDSKEAVLDAAQRLINLYGYSGFSMRDLAQESGLAKATLYHHFEDKREIFLQVLERDLNLVRDRIAAAAATPDDLPTCLRSVARTVIELSSERGLFLLSTLRQVAGMEREFCALMRCYRDELHRPIVERLAKAVQDGTIRPIDPELAATSYFGILQTFAGRHLFLQDIEINDQTLDFIVDFVLNGLRPISPGEPS